MVEDLEQVTRVKVTTDLDVVAARQCGRHHASTLGFSGSQLTVIATAISEVARNIVSYAGHGQITIATVRQDALVGIHIAASDDGPGIADIERSMQDGYSTGKSLGLGLPGTRRLMDEFEIESQVGAGTTVTMKKWVRK